MCDELFEEPTPEHTAWNRDALDHLSHDLHRSKSELGALLNEEAEHPAFDPLKVRNMIRQISNEGEEPTALILGRIEAASFRHFVSRGFGEESGSDLKHLFFMGLSIFEDQCPTRLEIIRDAHDDDSPTLAA
jgi:hypothetical protein